MNVSATTVMENEALLSAVRGLNEAAALTDADPKVTAEVLEHLTRAKELLAPRRRRLHRHPFEGPADIRARGGGSWQTGSFSTTQPRLRLTVGDEQVCGTWCSSPLDEGPPDMVHGGISAYLLDMISGTLVQTLGVRAVTAELTLRYRTSVPLEEELQLCARLARVDGRKHFVHGEIKVNGLLAVESEGLFITI